MTYNVGDRVRISTRSTWARGATGTIGVPPETIGEILGDESPYDGCRRFVRGRKGLVEFYWVIFDEAQIDADGDGLYPEAEIEADELEPIIEKV